MPDSALPLRRNRDFQLLWAGQALSALGSRVSAVAFPLLVFATTGSAAKTGIVLFAGSLPLLVCTLPAGVLVDRFDRKRVMVLCDASRAVALASIPLAIGFDRLTFAHILVVATIHSVGYTVFDVADRAALRHVVPFEQLPAAVSRIQAREYAALLLGKPLGGLLFGLGRAFPFVFDAITYAVSAVTVLLMRARLQEPQLAPRRHVLAEVGEGISWLARQRILRAASLFSAVQDAVLNALFLVVIVVAAERGGSSLEIGTALAFIMAFSALTAAVTLVALASRSIRHAPRFNELGPQEPRGDDAVLALA